MALLFSRVFGRARSETRKPGEGQRAKGPSPSPRGLPARVTCSTGNRDGGSPAHYLPQTWCRLSASRGVVGLRRLLDRADLWAALAPVFELSTINCGFDGEDFTSCPFGADRLKHDPEDHCSSSCVKVENHNRMAPRTHQRGQYVDGLGRSLCE